MSETTQAVSSTGFLKPRVSPAVFLLPLGYICLQAGFDTSFIGGLVTNFKVATWMFFLFSWLLPLVAICTATFQLIRYRSLQHAVELCIGVWLLLKALSLVVLGA